MSNLGQKLSFGFSKTIKKPNLLKNISEIEPVKKNVQLIDSIEESELKVHGKNADEEEVKDLIIPLTDEQKSRPISKLIESRRNKRNKNSRRESTEINGNTNEIKEDETLEQRAAREILEDLQNTEHESETKILELPLHPDELPLNGASESTIDDYERIPIADFGKAMLRGMGWKDEKKDEKEDPNKFEIFVRPKGLGLGADKVVKKQKLLVNPAPNETLEIKKNACIKILAGKHKNLYGTIEGFDDGGGRLVIKLAIGGLKVQMNEFMCQPVPKQEYAKYGKILNSEKYEEYKNDDGKKSSDVAVKQERKSRSPKRRERSKSPSTSSRARDRERRSAERSERDRKSTERRDRSRERRRSRDRSPHYSKSERRNHSSDSEDDKTYNRKYNEKHRKSRSHEKHRRRHSSSDSNSERYSSKKKSSKKSSKSKSKKYSSDDEKVHKKKYKRSKHHRDRS